MSRAASSTASCWARPPDPSAGGTERIVVRREGAARSVTIELTRLMGALSRRHVEIMRDDRCRRAALPGAAAGRRPRRRLRDVARQKALLREAFADMGDDVAATSGVGLLCSLPQPLLRAVVRGSTRRLGMHDSIVPPGLPGAGRHTTRRRTATRRDVAGHLTGFERVGRHSCRALRWCPACSASGTGDHVG